MSSNLTRNPNLDLTSSLSTSQSEAWRINIGKYPLTFPRKVSWWTGPDPETASTVHKGEDGNIIALPIPNLRTCTRKEIQDYFDNGWMLTELLFACLADEEAFYRPPYHNLRHPLIFYYTHPAVLYVNKLHVAGLVSETIHPYHERLFETGVDEMSWDDLSKNEMEWPSLDHCFSYRRDTYQIVSKVIREHPGLADGHEPINEDSPLWSLVMGFEHERIHLETSSVLIRELPVQLLKRHPGFPALPSGTKIFQEGTTWQNPISGKDYPANAWVKREAADVVIGKDENFPSFGWDNEYGRREVHVRSFAAQKMLASNGDYFEFVKEGGYREQRFWTDEGWRWRTFRNVKWPSFWVPVGPQGAHQYALRTCFEIVSMPWDWPVIANFHEAKAFAAWKSEKEGRSVPYRLMTEAEHHSLRTDFAKGSSQADESAALKNFTNKKINSSLRLGSETSVSAGTQGEVNDVFGNVWQWLEDHFHYLPGFEVHPFYDDFSTPCFDGLHQMIMGGSFISAGDEASVHARFHFRPHFGQHAGFRLIDPLQADNHGAVFKIVPTGDELKDEIETRKQQIFAAFSPDEQLLIESGMTPAKLDRNLIPAWIEKHVPVSQLKGRALEVGSGVGALTYRLASLGMSTIGADVSKLAIETAKSWQREGIVSFDNLDNNLSVKVELNSAVLDRIQWRQTDASSLPAEWLDFDLVVINRVLSQLPSPKGLLSRLSGERGLVKKGGFVIIADRFSWLERSTPKSLWLESEDLGATLGSAFEKVDSGVCFHVERPAKDLATFGRLNLSMWRRKS